MALRPDLAESRAKLERARKHLQTFQEYVTEAPRNPELQPYVVRTTRLNPKTGKVHAFLHANRVEEPALGLVFGDFIHNLRCSLDYIVSACVNATPNVTLKRRHQFPIYSDEARYRAEVGAGPSLAVIGMSGTLAYERGTETGLGVALTRSPSSATLSGGSGGTAGGTIFEDAIARTIQEVRKTLA